MGTGLLIRRCGGLKDHNCQRVHLFGKWRKNPITVKALIKVGLFGYTDGICCDCKLEIPKYDPRTYILHWSNGKQEIVLGKDLEDAFLGAGYRHGQVKMLDYFEEVK